MFLNTGGVSATISENRTRVRNKEYPSIATATTAQSIVYTVNKMNQDICQIRLDFGTFVIAGPSVSTEAIATGAQLCQDSLIITTTDVTATTSTPTGVLCGALTGEHLYVDLSPTASDAATLTLATLVSGTLTPAIAQRTWDIKVSQIECHANYRAPPGCQRYFMADYGKIISPNFMKITAAAANAQNSGVHLATQHLRSCIRRSKHMCCVEYQVCASYNGIALTDKIVGIASVNNGLYSEGFTIDGDNSIR